MIRLFAAIVPEAENIRRQYADTRDDAAAPG